MRNYLAIVVAILIGASILLLQDQKFCNPHQTEAPLEPKAVETRNEPVIAIDDYIKLSLRQDDPRILDYIWSKGYLIPPSQQSYDLKKPEIDPSMGQSSVVRKILGNLESGFFVECGALDGETRSNTLDLEMHYGWTGLLVEGDPKNFELLRKKHRKAWLARACLATIPHPHEVVFSQNFNVGKIASEGVLNYTGKLKSKEAIVQCFPLYSLLSAISQVVKTVDYFSLDVEGNEFQVLATIPWDMVQIRVLSVEYLHDKASADEIAKYMNTKGYRVVTTLFPEVSRLYLLDDPHEVLVADMPSSTIHWKCTTNQDVVK